MQALQEVKRQVEAERPYWNSKFQESDLLERKRVLDILNNKIDELRRELDSENEGFGHNR